MDDGVDLSTDVLVLTIMQRALPNARRQFRLVCRHWRQLVDTRTSTSLRSRAVTLAATKKLAPPHLRRPITICSCRAMQLEDAQFAQPTDPHVTPPTYMLGNLVVS
jgi:hypothetical protein